jgi:hypothetical protein
MTVLRMPGYGAERALGRAGASYPSRRQATADGGTFTLQAIFGRGGKGEPPGHCDPTCLCVTPEGCPCCVQLPPTELLGRVAR